jgi:hypothetical protein
MAVGMAAGATGISAVAAGATAISAVGRAGAITTRTAAGNGGKRPGLDGPASFPEIHSTPLQKFEAHRYHQPRPEERAFARVEGRQQAAACAAILRDAPSALFRMRSVGLNSTLCDPIGFMESIH